MKKLTPNKTNEPAAPAFGPQLARLVPAQTVEGELISREELARRLHKSIRTIANWQRRGLIPFVKIENSTWFIWPGVLSHVHSTLLVRPTPAESLLRIPVVGIATDLKPKDTR